MIQKQNRRVCTYPPNTHGGGRGRYQRPQCPLFPLSPLFCLSLLLLRSWLFWTILFSFLECRIRNMCFRFLAIEYRKFEVAVRDLHSGEYCGEESFVYEEAIGSGCLNPFLMLLRGAECGAKDDQCLLLRPLSGLTHLLLWW